MLLKQLACPSLPVGFDVLQIVVVLSLETGRYVVLDAWLSARSLLGLSLLLSMT